MKQKKAEKKKPSVWKASLTWQIILLIILIAQLIITLYRFFSH